MRSYLYITLMAMTAAALPSGIRAQSLHLSRGANLIVNGAPCIVLNNAGLTNNGLFIADSSTVIFTGDNARTVSFVDGNSPTSFYNLSIARSAGDLWLHNDAVIDGRINMQGGNLLLNNYTLNLGTTGSIQGESNYSSITGADGGVVKVRALLNAPRAVNPGNIGVAISSEANLGWTDITRGHIRQAAGAGAGIQRYFDIDPENNGRQPSSLRFYYLDGELDGRNGNELSVFSRERVGLDWTSHGKDQYDQVAGWITKENIGLLQRFTLAIPGTQPKDPGNLAGTIQVRVFPNPSAGTFRMALVSDSEKDKVISLYDLAGHLLERKKMHCIQGMNVLEWNVTGLAQGTYQLAADGLTPTKLVIMK